MKRPWLIVAIIGLMLALSIGHSSCSDESCHENGSSLPLAAFFMGNSQQTISGLTVMGIGVPGDSLLLDSASASQVYLPLQATTNSTRFLLRQWMARDSYIDDTLTFDYMPIEFFHSMECGAMFNFDISSVTCTHHAVDSVVLLTNLITNSPTVALRIYLTP